MHEREKEKEKKEKVVSVGRKPALFDITLCTDTFSGPLFIFGLAALEKKDRQKEKWRSGMTSCQMPTFQGHFCSLSSWNVMFKIWILNVKKLESTLV